MKNKPNEQKPARERSFTVALGQVAQLLRSEIKLRDRQTKVIPPSSLPSLHNFVEQVALMLRTQIQSKKRSWEKASNPTKIKNQ